MRNSISFKGVLTFLALAALLPACRSHPPNIALGTSEEGTLRHDGRDRRYLLYRSPSLVLTSGKVPLLLALHGRGGDAKSMEYLTAYGFNALADRDGFLVVYPEGERRRWNDGRKVKDVTGEEKGIDDVGFLVALIDRIIENLPVDPARVFITGMSNGGFMSHRLAVERPDRIAGAAAVGAAVPEILLLLSRPKVPVPVLMIGGTDDPLVPWEGGTVGRRAFRRGEILSGEESARFWAARNRCAAEPEVTLLPDPDPGDSMRVKRFLFRPGKGGADVALYAVEGGGHTWPGGWQYLNRFLIGKTCRDFDACDEIWEFFRGQERE
jgi:polyhydroxybutyrate depolymerase